MLTDYLSAVSPDWASKVGASTQPTFPTGTGAEHSSGVIAAMQATDGAITLQRGVVHGRRPASTLR